MSLEICFIMNLKSKLFLCLCLSLTINSRIFTQEFIPLWAEGKMPNSKGMVIKDSIYDERYRQVGTPGMFAYFPSNQHNKGTAVIICPGGGYKHFAYKIGGTEVAEWFNSKGINAFVLISRLPWSPDIIESDKASLQDAQRAIRLIRANAKQWGIDPEKIGVMGFSAGGHVASTLGTHLEDVSDISDSLTQISFHPDFMLLVSPVITMGKYTHKGSRDNLLGKNPSQELIDKYSNELQVTDQTPPAFIVHADDDKGVNSLNSIMFYEALHKHNVSVSLHIFPNGGHNIGLIDNPISANTWGDLCILWLTEMKFVQYKY